MNVDLCVGTVGMSVWFSKDLGENWRRASSSAGLNAECRVWTLTSSPATPRYLYAGGDEGVHRWDETEQRWTHLRSPMDGRPVWAIAQSPYDARVLLAGCRPTALYRSDDAGNTWRQITIPFAQSCAQVLSPRPTQILFDPYDKDTIWAGVEVDALYRSTDDGASWTRHDKGMASIDIHGVAVIGGQHGSQDRTIYVTTDRGPHRSRDNGESWEHFGLPSAWQYTRAVIPRPDNKGVIFITNGSGPPGSDGRLWRSRDSGKTWEDARLPGPVNSTVWWVATNAADPMLLFCCTNLGQMFRTTDGGETWEKLKREFGEIRTMMWRPATSG
jgi:photosystem II stability/assembly factor-like uncharacterized protein